MDNTVSEQVNSENTNQEKIDKIKSIHNEANDSIKYFEYGEALEKLQEAEILMEELTDSPEVYRNLKLKNLDLAGHIQQITGKWTQALRIYKSMLDLQEFVENKRPIVTAYLGKGEILSNRGSYMAALDNMKEGLILSEKTGDPLYIARCYISLGGLYSSMGEFETGKRLLEKAKTIINEHKDMEGMEFVQASENNQLGLKFFRNKEFEKAREQFQTTIEIMETYPYSFERAEALRYIGIVNSIQSEYKAALEHHSEALWIYQYSGYKLGQAKIYNSLGQACLSISRLNEAVHFMEKAESVCRIMEADAISATLYGKLGKVYMMKEEYDKAERFFTRDVDMCKKFENYRAMAFATANLGECSIYLGKNKQAIDYLKQSIELFRKKGDKPNQQRVGLLLVKAHINDGKLDDASRKLEELSEMINTREISSEAGVYLMLDAIIERHNKDWEKASQYFTRAIEVLKTKKDRFQLAEAYYEFGLLSLGLKDKDGALAKFKEAFRIARDLNLQKQRARYFSMIERIDEREIVKMIMEELDK
ncbi:MAG: tetratricopeptide repeat protein [Vulcanimicrobiota bacterium]